MNKFKKIFYIWLILAFVVILFHPTLYYVYVGKVFPKDGSIVGDLARMTYSIDLIDKRYVDINLERKHINHFLYNDENIDLITIGDSFSEGAGGGKNPYYQDYIANNFNLNVLNINLEKDNKNYIETIYGLLNSGKLEEKNIKYILIESVQRRSLERFSINDINRQIVIEDFDIFKGFHQDFIKPEKNVDLSFLQVILNMFKKTDKDEVSVINNLNQNALIYNLRFELKGYGKMSSHVYREKLNKDFFSTKVSNELLFYDEDLKYLNLETKENIELLNENFNILARDLLQKGIKLIFMPAVDKYNLYRPYIISNNYKESIFFEYLETLPKEYIFINTKKILSKELENGDKDIYYADDTHWSYKASQAIVNSTKFIEGLRD